jgi:hypothetical protein
MKNKMNNTPLKKKYTKPTLKEVKIDTELSLVMLTEPPLDPGSGFIEGISKFLIR